MKPHRVAGTVRLQTVGDRPVFEGAMKMLTTETSISSGNALVDDLISTRGMAGMLNTVWLILCAMCFGGTMTAGGLLRPTRR